MRIAVLIIVLLFATEQTKAQLSYPEVDSISYQLYIQKEWKKLISFSKTANKVGLSFFYLDLRTGISAYELGRWNLSQRMLKIALERNPASYLASEYLFQIELLTGKKTEADRSYNALPDSVQQHLRYKRKRVFNELYVESGLRFSDNQDSVKDIHYYKVKFHHKISPRFQLAQTIELFDQKLYWSKFTQQQYMLTPIYYVGKSWELSSALTFIRFNRVLFFHNETRSLIEHVVTPTPNGLLVTDSLIILNSELKGETSVQSINIHVNVTKRWKEFSLRSQVAFYKQQYRPLYDSISTTIYRKEIIDPNGNVNRTDVVDSFFLPVSSSVSYDQFQIGGSIDYTLRLGKNFWMKPGVELHNVIHNGSSNFVVVPYLELVFLNRFSLFGYYLQKDYFPVSIFQGSHVFNSYDKLNHRLNVTVGIELSNRMTMYLTYQNEKVVDFLSRNEYFYNSGYLGLNIKL